MAAWRGLDLGFWVAGDGRRSGGARYVANGFHAPSAHRQRFESLRRSTSLLASPRADRQLRPDSVTPDRHRIQDQSFDLAPIATNQSPSTASRKRTL